MVLGERMRIYYDLGFPSRGIERVITALEKYQPAEVERVNDPILADLTVLHVIGRRDHMLKTAQEITQSGGQYAIVQYALQSTRNPDPAEWVELWQGAKVVWSYYDLAKYAPRFYHAPLAADPEVFKPQEADKKYLIGTNGDGYYRVECVGEIRLAAWDVLGKVVHIGKRIDYDPHIEYFENIPDAELCQVYNQSLWWSGLRRKDGFELGAVEALLCGVRPIMFDTPSYRQWFYGLACFVPECAPGELATRLRKFFQSPPQPVTKAEIAETKKRFDWQVVTSGFWNCLLHQ
jgi:hypothetical protein